MKTNLLQKNFPKGWEIKKIKDLLDFEQPTKYIVESSSYTNTGKTAVLTANKSFVLGYTNETDGVYTDTPAIIFDDFTTDSKYVDFPFKIKSSAIKILKNRDENADLKFVYEIMKSFNFPIANHKRHYISQYQELDFVVPTIKEQKKIANILSSVDEEIEKLNSMINKSEILNNTLTHILFTKGVNNKKFKKTEIGIIPQHWKVDVLDKITQKISVGFVGTCEPFYTDNNGVPMIRTGNLKNWGIDTSSLKYVTREFHIKNLKSQVKPGDILIARHGENGLACLVPQDFGEANCLNVVIVRPDQSVLNSEYLFYAINAPVARKQIEMKSGGSTQKVVNTSAIKLVKIGIPDNHEQIKICSVLSAVNKKIEISKKLKEKLILLKKGLTSDLLSGKVRIN